jgi:hypothetical protein
MFVLNLRVSAKESFYLFGLGLQRILYALEAIKVRSVRIFFSRKLIL